MKKIFYILCTTAALAAGCSQEIEDAGYAHGSEVHFSAGVQSRAVGKTWETDDRIGIFAYDATDAATVVKGNAQYQITNAQNGTMGTATDADKIDCPTGKSLSFYAYYPFTSDEAKLTGTTYQIDATDQGTAEKTKALDLMWTKAESQSSTDVTLQFSHQMVKLTFNLTAGLGDLLDLTRLTATLQGANATAAFDLKTGAFSDVEAADITLTVAVDATYKTVATVSALVVPTADLSGVQMLFRTTEGKEFVWKPTTEAWTGGEDYSYNIRVGKTAALITDENFVNYLHDVKRIPVIDDGKIDPNDAATASALSNITELDVVSEGISSLAGIEYMPKLTKLDCGINFSLSNLDVSKNTKLTFLHCSNNSLSNLDVSKNTELTDLDCSWNSLTSLDVSKNTGLILFKCNKNSLTSLDITKLSSLSRCFCGSQETSGSAITITLTLTAAQETSITGNNNDWYNEVTLNPQN